MSISTAATTSTSATSTGLSAALPTSGRSVVLLLRAEAAAVLTGGVALYAWVDQPWWLFAALFLVPDLALAGYLKGPRAGAAFYNAAHTYAVPIMLGLAGALLSSSLTVAVAAVWTAHIGLDRLLGIGLKLPSGFRDTHLGRIGHARG